MKKLPFLFFVVILLSTLSCNEENNLLEIKDEAGLIVDISNTSGSLLGIPTSNVEVDQATVTFTEASLNYQVNLASGNTSFIKKIELVKTFSKDTSETEIIVTEFTQLPFSFNLNSIDEFLDGFAINPTELNIGDAFTFKLKIHQNDGDVYYYDSNKNITLTLEDPSKNDILNITTSWNNSYTISSNGIDTTFESCDQVDFDVYLYDENLNYIATIAESANCPEAGTISGLEDGKYMIGVYLFDNFISSYNINQTLPITIAYSQDGFIEETSFINTEFSTDDAWNDYKEVIVAEIEVINGYLYTITPL